MSTREPEEVIANLPIACALDAAEFETRSNELCELAAASVEKTDLENGIALRFEDTEELAARLVKFIRAERRCCPFFTFELVFEPNPGPMWLRARGPEGTRVFLEAMLVREGGGV